MADEAVVRHALNDLDRQSEVSGVRV